MSPLTWIIGTKLGSLQYLLLTTEPSFTNLVVAFKKRNYIVFTLKESPQSAFPEILYKQSLFMSCNSLGT